MSKSSPVLFCKSYIAMLVGCNRVTLKNFISEPLKEKLDFDNRYKKFKDIEAFEIIKELRPLATDEEIKRLIYPKGL